MCEHCKESRAAIRVTVVTFGLESSCHASQVVTVTGMGQPGGLDPGYLRMPIKSRSGIYIYIYIYIQYIYIYIHPRAPVTQIVGYWAM